MTQQTLAAAALAAALVVLPHSADAAGPFCKRQNGIDWCSRQVWDNQLAIGEPVMAFPRGCRGDACDFTVRLEFFAGLTDEEMEACEGDDPETPQNDCPPLDNCVLSMWFGPNVLRVRDWHGRNPETGGPATNAVINSVELLPLTRTFLAPSWEGHTSFTGRRYQWVGVIMADVEVFDNGLCRVNMSAGYHPNNKAFGSRGLLLPPIQ